jgi:hypothetical protein
MRARGYFYVLDGRAYEPREDRAATFPEVWREVRGVRNASIHRPDGSLVLADAGDLSVRGDYVRRARRKAGVSWSR